MIKKNYEEEAIKLSHATEIAIESFKKFPPKNWSEQVLNTALKCYAEFKNNALNPKPQFKKMSSLKYIIDDVFIYFQESSGEGVEYFWQQIKLKNLDYIRVDKIGGILKSGKIKNKIEFDYITDIIIPAKQKNLISTIQLKELSKMLIDFEFKKYT